MSSEAQKDAAMHATDVGLCAAAWLERRHHDDWGGEDQAAFDTWLGEALAHRVAYLRLEDAWRYADRLSTLQTPSREPRASRVRTAVKAVAALGAMIALLGAGAAMYSARPSEQVYATAIGEHRQFALDDGSKIELNTDTKLRVANGRDGRTVTLDRGEAYFQIRHNAKRPFVVIANGRRLTDLGTDFLVREDAQRLRVAIFGGRVQLDATGGVGRTALLTPGDVLLATANAQSIQHKNTAALIKDLGWREGVITLDNTTLADAAAEFNRYNKRKLVIADAASAQFRIMGTFRADNIEAFTSVAQDIFGLRVDRHESEIVVSR